ncbi:sulfotransferase-like domain-containing protein [Streptomyces zagrosensis]|uniref:Sulfotransferase family protein n=1 Tax=Streptomyces zagrosensis TaxID=1042984 RepID=A0A7W9V3H5_9ACTN|nr:sulfotransferase family protein [Streptomyces zagrosensis]MBB5940306.1 hypothetical protein [Streptomyces zagrosensis]
MSQDSALGAPDTGGRCTQVVGLWAVPRSVSTAFEKTFACRTDTDVVHEPFTDCYYFGPHRRSHRYGDLSESASYDGRAASEQVLSVAAPVVFVKDLAFQAGPYLSDDLLSRAVNTFIIRHPKRVLPSLTPLKPDFTEEEFGYTALHALFTRVVEELGHPPVVVEGDVFRRHPEAVLRHYCGRVRLPFQRSMLDWQDGRIRRWSEGEEESQAKWHKTLEASHTILPPDDDARIVVPPERRAQYERAVEIYEELTPFAVPASVSGAALEPARPVASRSVAT